MKKMIWLYLDDMRTPKDDNWTVVRSYDEFCDFIKLNGLDSIERISFDHDLGDTAMMEYYRNVAKNYTIDYDNIKEKTGFDCAKWLVNHSMDTGIPLPEIYIHSANPIGSANIMGYINNYYKNCRDSRIAQIARWEHGIDN
jgi:hypothetical protein